MMTNASILYSVADIRKIEQSAQANLAPGTLMQNAGAAAAQLALQLINRTDHCGRVLILAGPGNNGGDAFETGLRLDLVGIEVCIAFVGDAETLPNDALQAWQRVQNSRLIFIDPTDQEIIRTGDWDLVIDGLFGIGLKRAVSGVAYQLISAVNTLPCPVLALDIPSGLDADRGIVVVGTDDNKDGIAITASHTLSFIADKPGLHTADGRDYAGEVAIATLGIASEHFPALSNMQLNHVALFADALQARRQNSHKGNFGNVFVIGGASGMVGAIKLAGRAALKCGAGRVYLTSLDPHFSGDSEQVELMCRPLHEIETDKSTLNATLIVGPGLGMTREAHDLVAQAIASKSALVLDADALNLLANESGLQHKLASRHAATLLTPHPLEAARLLGITSAQVQSDRIQSAIAIAKKFNAIVILKGSGTVIATENGEIVINSTGNPALATAGAGDVLSGACGALLAQNWSLWHAALGAVWLHGKAADDAVENGIGPIGLAASELIPYLRSALNQLTRHNSATPTCPPQS